MVPETFRRRVAKRIKLARWRLGLTQTEAAEKIRMGTKYFMEVERGTHDIGIEVLFRVARGLKVSVADLVDLGDARVDLDALKLAPPKTGRKPTRPVKRRSR